MARLGIAIVGCGGMGRRHLRGLAQLARTDFNNLELLAACDLIEQNANDLADEARELLGTRPRVFTDLKEMARAVDGVAAADVTTEAGAHHRVAVACLEAGLHVLVEKPLALTIRGCNGIIEAARRTGRVLSVAENYRRDPMNRLARALIEAGAIGTPHLMLEAAIGGGDRIIITPWRHQKLTGCIALDEGVHRADILLYYLGPAALACGEGRIVRPVRYRSPDGAGPGGYYAKWAGEYPEQIEATGEDAVWGYVTFKSGAVAHLIDHHGAHGQPFRKRIVYGSEGSLESQGDRNGRPLTLHRAGAAAIDGERVLEFAPSYRLDPLTAHFFGGERVWRYELPFTETDARLIALEQYELAQCALAQGARSKGQGVSTTGVQPEVTGEVGRSAVAIIYALFESGRAGRAVSIEEVESGVVDGYQREIDEALGLV